MEQASGFYVDRKQIDSSDIRHNSSEFNKLCKVLCRDGFWTRCTKIEKRKRKTGKNHANVIHIIKRDK